jgi:fatty acid desaturase
MMFKKIGKLLVTVLAAALLVYSATRSLDFIQLTLPADKAVLGYFGLAALDGGLIAWLLAYLFGSSGGWQRGISLLMVLVDFVGCVTFFTLDALYNTGKTGLTMAMSQDAIFTAVIGLSAVIALNIGAVIAHHLTDPGMMKQQAEEEAHSMIEDAALAQIRQHSGALAAELAPQIGADWLVQTRSKYMHKLAGTAKSLAKPTVYYNAEVPAALNPLSDNGHEPK